MNKTAIQTIISFLLLFVILNGSALYAQNEPAKADPSVITVNAEQTKQLVFKLGNQKFTVEVNQSSATTVDSAKKDPASEEKVKIKKFSWESIKAQTKQFWQENQVFFKGFTLYTVSILFVGVLITLLLARLSRWGIEEFILIKFAHKTKTDLDELFCQAVGRPVAWLVISVGLYLSTLPITMSTPILGDDLLVLRICLAGAASSIAWGLYRLVAVVNHLLTKLAERTDNNLDDLIVAVIRKSLKVTVAIVSVLFIGQNILGINITTLLAGAGVVGLAIAFAAQDTIANFFGSIMIILDKPFKVGDRIQFGGIEGTIENVGFRSTRIRTLVGYLVTVPNKGLANDNVTNITERPYIKQAFNLGLTYDTPPEKMELAMTILHEILDNQECMDMENRPPMIAFNAFNDFSLNIGVTIWYFPADWKAFVQWYSNTNLEILKRFNAEGLEFAFPTNTTYLAYDANRQVEIKVKQE